MKKHNYSKLTERDVKAIKRMYATGSVSQRDLAFAFAVSQSTIYKVLSRKTWKHVQ